MLILTRRIKESIIIGVNVKITILGVSGNQVRVGIDAPKEIKVHREEIYMRVQADKMAAERVAEVGDNGGNDEIGNQAGKYIILQG